MFEDFADLSTIRLWCWDTGGDGEPIVLLHPASQSCQIWEHQREAFVKAGYRVVAYSRRGYFKSEIGDPADAGTSVADLEELLDYLSITKAHVVGAAAGALTALRFAVAHQGRVLSMVLAGTIFAPDEDDWRELFGRLGIAEVRHQVSTEFLELGPSHRATNPGGVKRFAELSDLALANAPPKQPLGAHVTWQTLEELEIPVLLLTGEADLYAPPPLQAMVASHLQQFRLETLREVGHAPYWEAPDSLNSAILDFLQAQDEK